LSGYLDNGSIELHTTIIVAQPFPLVGALALKDGTQGLEDDLDIERE
jgi:hypothetical protein